MGWIVACLCSLSLTASASKQLLAHLLQDREVFELSLGCVVVGVDDCARHSFISGFLHSCLFVVNTQHNKKFFLLKISLI